MSYSHRDEIFARWLQRALETWGVPRSLRDRETPKGVIPHRLAPVFRDRDELAAADSLSAEIEAALAGSRALIVICSPAAAKSRWVNAEIGRFAELHGRGQIHAAVVAGVPRAKDGVDEAFPPALVEGDYEPIAADFRPGHDGKRLGFQKLVAGMLGLGLDDIVQREAARARRRTGAIVGASLAGMTVTSGLALVAVDAQRAAEAQRDQAEGLVEYMLTDLRRKLEPVGRLEVLDGVGQRALAYYGTQDPDAMEADALGRRARAQMLVGEVSDLRGDRKAALAAFTEAATTTAELLARDPDNPDRIFDHAQSAFWVGYTAWREGDATTAEVRFREYKRLADELVAIDPKKPEWRMELAYALSNLGTVLIDRGRPAEAEPVFVQAYEIVRDVAVNENSSDRAYETATALAWVARARTEQAKYAQAADDRETEVAMYQRILATDPKNSNVRSEMAAALTSLSDLRFRLGDPQAALRDLDQANTIYRELIRIDANNTRWREDFTICLLDQAEVQLALQQPEAATRLLLRADENIFILLTNDKPSVRLQALKFRSETYRAILSIRKNPLAAAERAVSVAESIASTQGLASRLDLRRAAVAAWLVAGDAYARAGLPEQAKTAWRSAIDAAKDQEVDLRRATETRLGNTRDAKGSTDPIVVALSTLQTL